MNLRSIACARAHTVSVVIRPPSNGRMRRSAIMARERSRASRRESSPTDCSSRTARNSPGSNVAARSVRCCSTRSSSAPSGACSATAPSGRGSRWVRGLAGWVAAIFCVGAMQGRFGSVTRRVGKTFRRLAVKTGFFAANRSFSAANPNGESAAYGLDIEVSVLAAGYDAICASPPRITLARTSVFDETWLGCAGFARLAAG